MDGALFGVALFGVALFAAGRLAGIGEAGMSDRAMGLPGNGKTALHVGSHAGR